MANDIDNSVVRRLDAFHDLSYKYREIGVQGFPQ